VNALDVADAPETTNAVRARVPPRAPPLYARQDCRSRPSKPAANSQPCPWDATTVPTTVLSGSIPSTRGRDSAAFGALYRVSPTASGLRAVEGPVSAAQRAALRGVPQPRAFPALPSVYKHPMPPRPVHRPAIERPPRGPWGSSVPIRIFRSNRAKGRPAGRESR
jgi:hypothetical protein